MSEHLLKMQKAAELVGVSTPTIYAAWRAGELTAVYVRGKPRFERAAVKAWARKARLLR